MFGFPVDYETNFYYYNKMLIQQAGLEDPAAIWKRDPKAWNIEKFAEYATKLSTGDGDSRVYGAAEISKSLRTQAPFLWGNGADIFADDYKQAVFDSDKAIPAWQFLADHVTKGWSPNRRGASRRTRPPSVRCSMPTGSAFTIRVACSCTDFPRS